MEEEEEREEQESGEEEGDIEDNKEENEKNEYEVLDENRSGPKRRAVWAMSRLLPWEVREEWKKKKTRKKKQDKNDDKQYYEDEIEWRARSLIENENYK